MWQNVPKPTGANYTNVNPQGKQQYDQANLTYDEPSVYYDSVDVSTWFQVPKPTGDVTVRAGRATGLIMPPTYTENTVTNPWTKVSKPQ